MSLSSSSGGWSSVRAATTVCAAEESVVGAAVAADAAFLGRRGDALPSDGWATATAMEGVLRRVRAAGRVGNGVSVDAILDGGLGV